MVSIVIPSRNEKYLQKTIQDLLAKARGDIEIIAVLDGYWPSINEIVDGPRIRYLHFSNARGMRNAINAGVAIANGEYILKTDAHCMFAEGFDAALVADCADDWVVVPRRLRLDPEKWELTDTHKPPVDHMYLSYPEDPTVWGGKSLQGKEWTEKNQMGGPLIDDLMTAQGSCWFMKRKYFEFLELMDEANFGEFGKEMQEIGLKCWLSGGRMVVNKGTWYAHWHKPKDQGRGYSLSKEEFEKASAYTLRFFTEATVWHKQIHSFQWLLKKFWPVPGWPVDTI